MLDRLETVGLVDDREFARMFVRAKHAGRGLARSALRRELARTGVEGEAAEQALEQVDDQAERRTARELVEKKVRARPVPTGGSAVERAERDKHVRRLVAMLARRGHAPSLAFAVVRDVIDAQDAD